MTSEAFRPDPDRIRRPFDAQSDTVKGLIKEYLLAGSQEDTLLPLTPPTDITDGNEATITSDDDVENLVLATVYSMMGETEKTLETLPEGTYQVWAVSQPGGRAYVWESRTPDPEDSKKRVIEARLTRRAPSVPLLPRADKALFNPQDAFTVNKNKANRTTD